MTEKPKKLRGFPGRPLVHDCGGCWVTQDGEDTLAVGPTHKTKAEAIRAWNRMVEKAMGERS
jgi:hypothetical protein